MDYPTRRATVVESEVVAKGAAEVEVEVEVEVEGAAHRNTKIYVISGKPKN
jgi:hypothetical protein